MKNLVFISCILIILFKTGNVLSNTNIFSVNNIEINKESYKNRDLLINQIFKKGFLKLIERLLLDEDYKNLSEKFTLFRHTKHRNNIFPIVKK